VLQGAAPICCCGISGHEWLDGGFMSLVYWLFWVLWCVHIVLGAVACSSCSWWVCELGFWTSGLVEYLVG